MHRNHHGKILVNAIFSLTTFFFISHESKFKTNVREEYKDGKYDHRTMGYAEEPLPNPTQFLKKKPNDSKTVARKFFFSLLVDLIIVCRRKRNIGDK